MGEAVLDDDGFGKTDIVIRARVTKQGSDVTVDLTEIRSAGDGLHQFLTRQHAIRRRDGVRVSCSILTLPRTTARFGR